MKTPASLTQVIEEGGTLLVVPALERGRPRGPAMRSPVFYNPQAALSRDLALLALKTYASGATSPFRVADPLTGVGSRAIRYAKEGPADCIVVASDLSSQALTLAREAARLNRVEARVTFHCKDARTMLLEHASQGQTFNSIDVDPFGSPAPFLQAATSALAAGGLLALSATDSATLSGIYPRTCLGRYLAKPLRTEYHHEVAARILVGFAARTLASQGLDAHPLIAHSLGYTLRVHLEGKAFSAGDPLSGIGYLLHCFHCLHRELRSWRFLPSSQECPNCRSRMVVAGPLWTGPLFDSAFCAGMLCHAAHASLARRREAIALLTSSLAEATAPATYFVPAKLAAKAGRPVPSRTKMAAALRRRGYCFADTHFEPSGFRTDASIEAILEVLAAG